MSNGLKIGLIIGGAAVVGYVVLRSSSAAAPLPLTPATGGALTPAPGSMNVASLTATATSTAAKVAGTAALTAAVGPFALLTNSTVRGVVSSGVKGAVSGIKSVGSSIGSAASSAYHDVASIF